MNILPLLEFPLPTFSEYQCNRIKNYKYSKTHIYVVKRKRILSDEFTEECNSIGTSPSINEHNKLYGTKRWCSYRLISIRTFTTSRGWKQNSSLSLLNVVIKRIMEIQNSTTKKVVIVMAELRFRLHLQRFKYIVENDLLLRMWITILTGRTGKFAQWLLRISEITFDIAHRAGIKQKPQTVVHNNQQLRKTLNRLMITCFCFLWIQRTI